MKRVLVDSNYVIKEIIGKNSILENLTLIDAPDNAQIGDILNVSTIEADDNQAQYIAAIESLLKSTARSKGYDNEFTIIGYKDSANVTWATEAANFISWRDQVWTHALDIFAQVQNNQIPPPTIEEFVAGLPLILWS